MNYFLKKEAIIILLYIILIKILRSGDEKRKIAYWQIAECFIIVVGLEAMTGYYASSMSSNTDVIIYAIAQWMLLNSIYIIVGLTIYHVCTGGEISYVAKWKRFPLWIRNSILVSVGLGVILTVLDCHYSIEMMEQFQEQLEYGTISFMDSLTMNVVNPYHRIRELLRFTNIGILVYGCNVLYKNYDKCSDSNKGR